MKFASSMIFFAKQPLFEYDPAAWGVLTQKVLHSAELCHSAGDCSNINMKVHESNTFQSLPADHRLTSQFTVVNFGGCLYFCDINCWLDSAENWSLAYHTYH